MKTNFVRCPGNRHIPSQLNPDTMTGYLLLDNLTDYYLFPLSHSGFAAPALRRIPAETFHRLLDCIPPRPKARLPSVFRKRRFSSAATMLTSRYPTMKSSGWKPRAAIASCTSPTATNGRSAIRSPKSPAAFPPPRSFASTARSWSIYAASTLLPATSCSSAAATCPSDSNTRIASWRISTF